MWIEVETFTEDDREVVASFDVYPDKYGDVCAELRDARMKSFVDGASDTPLSIDQLKSLGVYDELADQALQGWDVDGHAQETREDDGDRLRDIHDDR